MFGVLCVLVTGFDCGFIVLVGFDFDLRFGGLDVMVVELGCLLGLNLFCLIGVALLVAVFGFDFWFGLIVLVVVVLDWLIVVTFYSLCIIVYY